MSATALARAAVLIAKIPEGKSPAGVLLLDDEFCAAVMQHRLSQGWAVPELPAGVPADNRLSYLQALTCGEGVAEARLASDHLSELEKTSSVLDLIEDPEVRDAILKTYESLRQPNMRDSYWAGLHILLGDRIPQESILLFDPKTFAAEPRKALEVIEASLARLPCSEVTMSSDGSDGAKAFITVGREPSYVSYPELAGRKNGTNAAIFHYEIDHPGGGFAFFNQVDTLGAFETLCNRQHRNCPLSFNGLHEMMALNSFWLQSQGMLCVRAGDTQVTLLTRDGVTSASVTPDLSAEAANILHKLAGRGMPASEMSALSPWLHQTPRDHCQGGDYDWAVIEAAQAIHPDLLGNAAMSMDRSQIMGAPVDTLRARIIAANGGDETAGERELSELIDKAAVLDLPAGRLHLYVPNLASPNYHKAGLAALDAACGRAHEELWFVLSDRPLGLGDDPHMVTTMRRMPEAPEPCPEP